ncbi:MAG: hypothetical protein ACRC8S_12890 [Fimbriiglobus sp.]
MITTTHHPTAHTVPHPVLFNTWKHHAGWVREQIADAAARGEAGLVQLSEAVVVCGTTLMDFYFGQLTPWQLGEQTLAYLRDTGKSDFPTFQDWLQAQDGYAPFDIAEDGSKWILRSGVQSDRYVHLHPGRYSPHTIRVPGITLKTAIMALAFAKLTGADAMAVGTVNEARKRYLDLPPMAAVKPGQGLGEVLTLLGG